MDQEQYLQERVDHQIKWYDDKVNQISNGSSLSGLLKL
jgi:hypothetical protein